MHFPSVTNRITRTRAEDRARVEAVSYWRLPMTDRALSLSNVRHRGTGESLEPSTSAASPCHLRRHISISSEWLNLLLFSGAKTERGDYSKSISSVSYSGLASSALLGGPGVWFVLRGLVWLVISLARDCLFDGVNVERTPKIAIIFSNLCICWASKKIMSSFCVRSLFFRLWLEKDVN